MAERKVARQGGIRGMARRKEYRELIGAMKGGDRGTLCRVLDALVDAGEAAVPDLIRALGDEDHRVHMVASIALRKIGKPAVLPLIRAFRDGEGATRQKIASVLAEIGEPALREILGALQDHDEEVRALSALAAGEMRSPRAIDPLLVALRDESEKVRARAAVSLGELGAPGTEEALGEAAAKDPSPAVRQLAEYALLRVRVMKGDRAAARGIQPGQP